MSIYKKEGELQTGDTATGIENSARPRRSITHERLPATCSIDELSVADGPSGMVI
jgi:hypothetical protein